MRACTNTQRGQVAATAGAKRRRQAERNQHEPARRPTRPETRCRTPVLRQSQVPFPAQSQSSLRDPPGREPGAPAKLIATEIGQNENAASCGRRSGQCAARGAVAMDTHHRVADAFLPYLVAMCGLRDSDRQGCWACEATLLFSSAPSGGTTNARVPHRRWLQRAMPSRYRRSVQHMILGKSP